MSASGRWTALAAFVAALFAATPARADSTGLPPPPAVDAASVVAACGQAPCSRKRCAFAPCRRLDLSLPVWVPGVTGSLATATREASSDGGFFDRYVLVKEAVSELKFAFVGRVEGLWRGWWGLADLYAVTVGSEVDWTVGTGTTSVELDATIGRLVLGREVLRLPTDGCGACLTLTPYVGMRSYHVRIQIEDEVATRDWVDAIVGVEARWWFHPRWNLRLLADLGTAVDTGWDLSGMTTLEIHWCLSRHVSLFAGYSVLDLTHDHEGTARFEVDLTLAGPQLGITVHL